MKWKRSKKQFPSSDSKMRGNLLMDEQSDESSLDDCNDNDDENYNDDQESL
jgi:hypothetical protein